jgi:hypothetical protein
VITLVEIIIGRKKNDNHFSNRSIACLKFPINIDFLPSESEFIELAII